VVAVGSNDAVIFGNCSLHSNGHGFLTIVEVAKSTDEFGLVERVGGYLHTAHRGHDAEEGLELLGIGLDGA